MMKRIAKTLRSNKPAICLITVAAIACVAAAVYFLANPATKSDTKEEGNHGKDMIQYQDQWYSREDLSEDTIKWMEWYNCLSPEEQLAISYVPHELQERSSRGKGFDNLAVLETNAGNSVEADRESGGSMEENKAEKPLEEAPVSALSQAIRSAILQKKKGSYSRVYDFACCDFAMLEVITDSPATDSSAYTVTCYGWALYLQFLVSDNGLDVMGGCHIPTVLTFTVNQDHYILEEYWEPRDGSYFALDIQNKFPSHLAGDGIDSQKFIIQQQQSCYSQAVRGTLLDTDKVIRQLLDALCSGPGASFNPQTVSGQNNTEYRELIKYGEYTLSYCLNQFDRGGETDLNGKIMAFLCEELLQTRGILPLDAADAVTGQLWYDTLYAHASNLVNPYLENK